MEETAEEIIPGWDSTSEDSSHDRSVFSSDDRYDILRCVSAINNLLLLGHVSFSSSSSSSASILSHDRSVFSSDDRSDILRYVSAHDDLLLLGHVSFSSSSDDHSDILSYVSAHDDLLLLGHVSFSSSSSSSAPILSHDLLVPSEVDEVSLRQQRYAHFKKMDAGPVSFALSTIAPFIKYLSLRGNWDLEEIPKSIGNLQMLETLDLKYTGVTKLPDEILKLHRLRHLLVGYTYGGFKALKGMEKMSCLENLYTIQLNDETNIDNDDILRSISKLIRLRKVNIRKLRSRDGKELCSTLDKLTELRSLRIATVRDESMDIEPVSSPPKYLHTVCVDAKMEKLPQWIASLHCLTKLKLTGTKLKGADPLQELGDLPSLTCLELSMNAYVGGEELCFKEGTFKQLTSLSIWWLQGLKRVRVMEGAMPRLEKLTIKSCRRMDSIPSGIETLSSLSLLEFDRMSDEFNSKVKRELCENGNPHPFQIRLSITKMEYGNFKTTSLLTYQNGIWSI